MLYITLNLNIIPCVYIVHVVVIAAIDFFQKLWNCYLTNGHDSDLMFEFRVKLKYSSLGQVHQVPS
jgi:hypothetical protein